MAIRNSLQNISNERPLNSGLFYFTYKTEIDVHLKGISMEHLEQRLEGGHPNSLGQTVEVVEEVLKKPRMFEELFNCYFSKDEVVRLRTSNAIKRISKAAPDLILPYLDRLLSEVSLINQASIQWTLAQLFLVYGKRMSASQMDEAKALLRHNLEFHKDWIVLNTTMDTLAIWSQKDQNLRGWFLGQLQRLKEDKRKSVANKALKSIRFLNSKAG